MTTSVDVRGTCVFNVVNVIRDLGFETFLISLARDLGLAEEVI
jgi:hypothetical protein